MDWPASAGFFVPWPGAPKVPFGAPIFLANPRVSLLFGRMGRKLSLKPRFDHARGKWVLSIPARLSDTGARKRMFWDRGDEEKAIEHARRLRSGLEHFEKRAVGIRPDLMETAIKWDEVVKEHGYHGLEHFCAQHFKALEKAAASPQLSRLLDIHERDHRKNWSAAYLCKRWKPFRARLAEIEDVRISHLDQEAWREWFAAWAKASKPSAATYNQQLGMLRVLFDLAAAKAVFVHNPLADIPAMKERLSAVHVSTPAEVRLLLSTAWEKDRAMVPYFAVCYFAGLRPDSEARRLRFQDIDWRAGHILVDVTKTSDNPRRFVEIEDALREWLRPWLRSKGPIVPENFAKRRRRLIYGYHTTPGAVLAEESTWKPLVPWAHDITRHSYGSFWEARHRGEAGSRERIVANMGHANFKTFERYYRNARPPAEAAEFWDIRPPAEAGNIVAIA